MSTHAKNNRLFRMAEDGIVSQPKKSNPDIYLCGPMTGLPHHNLPAFAEAERRLTSLGYKVFNPGEMQDESMSFEDYMRPELKILMNTRYALVALPGWEEGVGSRLEVMIAASIGLRAYLYDPEVGLGAAIFDPSLDSRATVAQLLDAPTTAAGNSNGNSSSLPPHLEAADLVLGPRGEYYDHPYDNFNRTAHLWTGILYSKLLPDSVVDPDEVSLCLVALKLARETFRHKRDNVVDAHGYLLTHMMVLDRMKELQGKGQDETPNDD